MFSIIIHNFPKRSLSVFCILLYSMVLELDIGKYYLANPNSGFGLIVFDILFGQRWRTVKKRYWDTIEAVSCKSKYLKARWSPRLFLRINYSWTIDNKFNVIFWIASVLGRHKDAFQNKEEENTHNTIYKNNNKKHNILKMGSSLSP